MSLTTMHAGQVSAKEMNDDSHSSASWGAMEPIFSRLSARAASVADLPPLRFMAFMALEQRSVFRKRGNASKARLWSVRSASFSTALRIS